MTYVLVVDDDQTLCDLLGGVLEDEGYEVRCARSAAEALAVAEVRQPEVIVTDLCLADESGAAFIETYRRLPGAHARVVIVSGMAGLDEEAARLKVDGFLPKPFDLDALTSTVANALTSAALVP